MNSSCFFSISVCLFFFPMSCTLTIINSGLKIIYEPRASVFHYHGIHHDQNPQRAKNVVKILESLKTTSTNKKPNKK